MHLPVFDRRACRRARLARDARFDGRFFVAVTTTGIYCRPICPAPRPHEAHVRYFPSAAAAAEAGFRPCLRCRPEASPGTPAWSGTAAVVTRALRLIAGGAMDDGGVDGLAARVGLGARQLHRLFVQHVGAPPVAVAQTARVELAKRLIDETTLPMTTVALAAGFGSVRRFNDAFRRAYGRPPTAIRRAGPHAASAPSSFRLRLAYRPPFDWEAMLGFLASRSVSGLERVDEGRYTRAVAHGSHAGLIEVRHAPRTRSLDVTIHFPDPTALAHIVSRVRAMFDIAADPQAVSAVLRRDPLLARLVRAHPGLRVPGTWDPAEIAVRAVVGQQISVPAATRILGRLVERYGTPVPGTGGEWRLFPAPAALAEADLDGVGLMPARALSLCTLARRLAEGTLRLDPGADPADTRAALLTVPGIGAWTAEYIAMRALGDPDAFPEADLGLRSAAGNGTRLSAAALAARAESWRPWRAYAAAHLWHHLGGNRT